MGEPFHLPLIEERPSRPTVRADCLEGGINEFRPCPWIGCRYNIAESQPDQPTCALDVADEGGVTLEEIGAMMHLTRERIRQVEDIALRKIRKADLNFRSNTLKNLLRD
jgi:hypothetical protein